MTARGAGTVLASAVVAVALTGCVPDPATDAAPSTSAPGVTFVAVIDGDTIETSAGKVRIIGIDAPERGQCGYDDAGALLSSLLDPGDPLALELPDGQNDEDGYGRMLRYVDTAQGIDVAEALLAEGLAVARYDSTDGYPEHPRESGYHAAQAATLTAGGAVMTTACQTAVA